jgi:hypothetical protein
MLGACRSAFLHLVEGDHFAKAAIDEGTALAQNNKRDGDEHDVC